MTAESRGHATGPATNKFPKTAHILKRGEFAHVFDTGRRVALPALALHWAEATQPRLGLAVSRKVDPRAVGRNRIKRVLREAFRHARSQLLPADYVVVARSSAARLDNAGLRIALSQLLQRAGTMRAACVAAPAPPTKSDA